MATIEERAKESQRLHKDESKRSFNKDNASFSEWCFGYCQGVTEQDRIARAEERERCIKAFCVAGCPNKEIREYCEKKCGFYNDFIKEMKGGEQ